MSQWSPREQLLPKEAHAWLELDAWGQFHAKLSLLKLALLGLGQTLKTIMLRGG